MGRPIEVHITHAPESAAGGAGQNYFQAGCTGAALDADLGREPAIQAVLEIFDGEIIR
jgi:hypothetical protein